MCDTTMNAVAGLATFTGCVLNNIGTGYTLGATASGNRQCHEQRVYRVYGAHHARRSPVATTGKRYRVIR